MYAKSTRVITQIEFLAGYIPAGKKKRYHIRHGDMLHQLEIYTHTHGNVALEFSENFRF